MVNINEEQITRLKTQAEQFGWVDSQQFKDKVNTQYWAGSYDKLVKNVAGSIQSWSIQGNMENANKIISSPMTADNNITNSLVDEWKLPESQRENIPQASSQTPTLPAPTATPTESVKTEAPVTPKPTNLWTIQGKNVMSEAPEFKGADWQTYKTVRFDDGSLWTVKVWEGWVNELIGSTYKDEQRADMKQIVEQWLNNADNIYRQLYVNWNIPESVKNTKAFTSAKVKFDLYNRYSNASADNLYSAFVNWEIPSDMHRDLMTNPNYAVAKEKYDRKISADNTNNQMSTMFNVVTGSENKVTDKSQELSDKLYKLFTWMGKTEEDMLSFKDFMSQNYPDIVSQSTELNSKNKQLRELQDVADWRLKEIQNKYPWMSKWSAMVLAAKENESLYEQMKTLQFNISELSANLQFQTQQADKEYSYEQEQQARQDRLEQEQRWYAFNMLQDELGYQRTLEDRQYQEDLATRRMQQEYDFTYGDFNSEDPRIRDTAIRNAVAQLYTQYPIPGMEAQAVKEQKVKDLIAQGLTGQQAISQLEQEIRNSNRYKQYLASEQAKMMPQSDKPFTVSSGSAVYDPATGTFKYPTGATTDSTSWNVGWYYSGFRITQDVWAKSPNSKDTWYNGWTPWIDFAMPENTPVLSTVEWEVTFVWNNWDYGNQVVVKDSNGNLHMYSHLNNSNVQVWDTVSAWQNIALSGGKKWAPWAWFSTWAHLDYRVKSTDWKWQDPKQYLSAWTQYNQDKIELLAEISQIQSETEKRKALESAGLTLQDLTRYKADSSAGKIPPTQAQIQAALWTISDIQWLAQTDWTDATGKFDYTRLIWTPDATDAGVLIENLKNKSAFNNLGMLKWPMSDKDLWFLQNVSSKLDPVQSNKQFEKNIVEMYNIAARKAWIKEITKLSEIPKDRILPWQQNTWTSTWNTYNVNGKQVNENDLFDRIYNW